MLVIPLDLHILHQTCALDCDTCTLPGSWSVSTLWENQTSSQLRRRTQLIQPIPMIAWWIKFLTHQSLSYFETIGLILSTSSPSSKRCCIYTEVKVFLVTLFEIGSSKSNGYTSKQSSARFQRSKKLQITKMPFGRKRTDSQEIKGFFTVSIFFMGLKNKFKQVSYNFYDVF